MAHFVRGFRGSCAAVNTARQSSALSKICTSGCAPLVAMSGNSGLGISINWARVYSHGSLVSTLAGCSSAQLARKPTPVAEKGAHFLRSWFSTAASSPVEKSPELFKALKARESAHAAGLPAHLRHPFGGNVAESFTDKVYRWLDVTGVLTRWNNRKEWVLDLIPMNRLGSSTVTEFERKQEMFVTLNAQILALIALYLAYTGIQHVNVKPANPSYEGFAGVDGRKKDFTMTNRLFFMHPKERCKECRWLDLECKKACFTRLKAEGYKLIINNGDPLSIPRTKLEPPHFH